MAVSKTFPFPFCLLLIVSACIYGKPSIAQDSAYLASMRAAISLFDAGQYMNAARAYGAAFSRAGSAALSDRYAAARAWSAAGDSDSSFRYLNRLPGDGWDALADLESAQELAPLHSDPRWTLLTNAFLEKRGRGKESAAGMRVLFSRPVRGRTIVADEIGNVYLTRTDNTLTRFNASGDSTGFYRGVINGDIGYVDVTNPLRILLYYPEQQRIVILGRMMDVLSDIDLRRLGIVQRSAIAMSADGGIWVWDARNGRLIKINTALERMAESNDLRQQIGFFPQPQVMQEKNRRLYMLDTAAGLLRFDQFGSYTSSFPLKNVSSFSVTADRIVYTSDNRIYSLDPATSDTQSRSVPRMHAVKLVQAALSRNVLYALYEDRLVWYKAPD